MATQFKYTVKRGSGFNLADITIGAGSAEAQSDTISLNVDMTNLTKGEALDMVEALEQKIQAADWPAA